MSRAAMIKVKKQAEHVIATTNDNTDQLRLLRALAFSRLMIVDAWLEEEQ
jgi:23S rRNA C2498 (ribose-2'-O)-methylase RlmM